MDEAVITAVGSTLGTTHGTTAITYTPATADKAASISFVNGETKVEVNSVEAFALKFLEDNGFENYEALYESVSTPPDPLPANWVITMYFTQKVARESVWLKAKHPDWSDARCVFQASLNVTSGAIHFALDLFGLVPGAGEIADLINGGVYLLEGNGTDAALSFAAMLPIGGQLATLGKWTKKALKYTGDGFQTVSGLIFKLGSAHGNRLSHVVAHLKDLPTRPGVHSYFSQLTDTGELIKFLDDEYLSIIQKNFNPNLAEGASQTIGNITKTVERNPINNQLQDVFIIDHGSQIVGKLGGMSGNQSSLYKVKMIFSNRTSELITSYPTP